MPEQIAVYECRCLCNDFQMLVAEDDDAWRSGRLDLDGTPKLPNWVPESVRVYNPKKPLGDFLTLTTGGFVVTERACDMLRTPLELAGEILPLNCPRCPTSLYLINILEWVDALDHDATMYRYMRKTRVDIIKHVFIESMLPGTSLFKLPERPATVYVSEGWADPQDDFKLLVEKHGLQGLYFEEVWRNCQIKDARA